MLLCCIRCFLLINLRFIRVERKDIELVDEEEPQIGSDCCSVTSNKSEIYNEEAGNVAQKHKPKRVESVNADAEAFGDSTVLKIGDSAKVVIKQDMKGGEHKYGFNNNKREKPEKVRVVDDETGDKHELYEVLRMPSSRKNQ
ncbi:hypothetical protein HKD37_01G001215 [Glycine soja]